MKENDRSLQGFTSGGLRLLPAVTPRKPPSERRHERHAEPSSVEAFVERLGTAEGQADFYGEIIRAVVSMDERGPSPAFKRDERRLRRLRREEDERERIRTKAVPEVPDLDLGWLDAEDEAEARAAINLWLDSELEDE